ncbi:hypothetical protein PVAND_009174 [Polypedilum vanderplanki]|uniref:Uncharacterized protein n=1 Tax=Polypedilum vanderplanki TaxID=319348 RepID=A0A9J6CDA3_POLVA|nr:hypothetical protein PVAND_009174 [Polypedilum vanderplanki]
MYVCEKSVYRGRFNDGILMLQQSGIIQKIMNDVRWDMMRTSSGALLQIGIGKALKITSTEEKGLTLADTEGMFLLLGIGFLIAAGALVSEWVDGFTNKCMKLVKVKQEKKREEHRLEEERIEAERIEEEKKYATELAKHALHSVSSTAGILLDESNDDKMPEDAENKSNEIIEERKKSMDKLVLIFKLCLLIVLLCG